MDADIKKEIVYVLTKALSLIKREDFVSLKELSNHVIDNAAIYQDKDSIQVAVIIYSLAKILEREKSSGKQISASLNIEIEKAVSRLIDNDEEKYRKEITHVFRQIHENDEKLYMYIQNIIEKANIAKGTKVYEHGISAGRVSEILGISQWDLMSFIGKTRIADEEGLTPDISKRLSFAKKLFKVT
ncbi:TPA: hypothetical protein HA219_01480 [Candidatus Woesearchaeota archaeon]|nr:hypothetical protein [Candidatus Woesearchaeota archaeon]HIH39378.1 hypothetical protein [Candidatus Woesearchaeota archaeon]